MKKLVTTKPIEPIGTFFLFKLSLILKKSNSHSTVLLWRKKKWKNIAKIWGLKKVY